MSDLKDELEANFASAEMQSNEPINEDAIEEQTKATVANVDEWMDAPKAYPKEYQETFATLSPEWRKLLIEREKQTERGFSDIGNKLKCYKWADDVFGSRKERLNGMGFTKSQEYVEHLAQIDDALANNPAQTINLLAQAYGVNFGETNSSYDALQGELRDIRQMITNHQAFINNQQTSEANKAFDVFVNATDEAGNLKHQYLDDVRADMVALIKQGVCTNLEDAYNKAIWTNENVRAKLIETEHQKLIEAKAKEASKAKEAGFSLKSKAETADRPLTLREELEQRFRENE